MRSAAYLLYGAFGALLLVVASSVFREVREAALEERLPWEVEGVLRDLDEVRADTLRVLVLRDPLTWEERPHGQAGLEYELLERFAEHLGTPVRAVPMDHPDSMLLALQLGLGDVVAAQVPPRRDRRRWLAYSRPYRHVRPVLATLRPDPLVPLDRSGPTLEARVDTAELSVWSPFADPGYGWEKGAAGRIPLHVDPLITPEDLLMEVLLGRHGATVVTDARAHYEAGRFPVLEFSAPIGPEQPLCFVLRRTAPQLRRELDHWLEDPRLVPGHKAVMDRYAAALPKPGPLRTRRMVPVQGDSISPFDNWFKEHAEELPWDWELLAAMAYKESRFDSTVTSRKGAQGIMQIMPRTAERLGLQPGDAMEDHIAAAVRYLNKLDTLWRRAVPDREQRLRFVLASYNAGPGHIIDAQRLAQRLGLDPDRWEHHVERAVLLLAKPRYYMLPEIRNGYCNGRQVFHYVREVLGLQKQIKARPRQPQSRSSSSSPERAAE